MVAIIGLITFGLIDEASDAKAILDKMYAASIYSQDGRPSTLEITTDGLRKDGFSGDRFMLQNSLIRATFRRNPLRIHFLDTNLSKPRDLPGEELLGEEVLTRICKRVTRTILPSHYDCVARLERLGGASQPGASFSSEPLAQRDLCVHRMGS